MYSLRSIFFITLLTFGTIITASANHFKGGEIRYTHVKDQTYSVEVVMYTNAMLPEDLPEITVDWGDGTTSTMPRIDILDNLNMPCWPQRVSTYQAQHTWPGPGSYHITTMVVNRSSGIVNIPESVNVPACISALLVIDPDLGPNNSIRFDNSQAYFTWNWNTLIHDPGMSEAEGDSVTFELAAPLGVDCSPVNSWAPPGAPGTTWLDPANGIFHWDLPQPVGEWNLTIHGSEWRNGQLIGQAIRDMMMCVTAYEVGIEEWTERAMPQVYPTLTDGPLWVVNPTSNPMRTEILTVAGSSVYTFNVLTGTHPLDLSDLVAGTYLVRITDVHHASTLFRVVRH